MTRTTIIKLASAAAAGLLLTACQPSIQTTSGTDYLQRYSEQSRLYSTTATPASASGADTVTRQPGAMAPDIEMAAEVEPLLTFPARIGLARLEGGRLSAIPPAEGQAWRDLAERLGPEWGEFVPLNPLIVGLTTQEIDARVHQSGGERRVRSGGVVHDIRIGAARQHTDAVLIYESASQTEISTNPLAVTKLLLVGYFLAPSEHVESTAAATAVLVDVRNGYTYGTANAVSPESAETLATSVNEYQAKNRMEDRAKVRAVTALAGEVEEMALKLRTELAETRLARMQEDAQTR